MNLTVKFVPRNGSSYRAKKLKQFHNDCLKYSTLESKCLSLESKMEQDISAEVDLKKFRKIFKLFRL